MPRRAVAAAETVRATPTLMHCKYRMLIASEVVCCCECRQPSMWNLPSMLNFILGYEDMGAKQGRETLVLTAKKHCRGTSAHTHTLTTLTF